MSEQSPDRAAAIIEAATAALAIDASDVAAAAARQPGWDHLTPAEVVARVKEKSPHWFNKRADEMTDAEYKESLRGIGIRPENSRGRRGT